MSLPDDVMVVARGEADQPQRDLFDPAARTLVRYADPAAWVTATAIARALDPLRDVVAADHDQISVVVTSDCGPIETMATVAEAARAGFASPLRYPAANPWSLAGVACILFGLRGFTLTLTMPPATGVPIGLLMAGRWLHHHAVPLAIVASCSLLETNRYMARCLALVPPASSSQRTSMDRSTAFAWLRGLAVAEESG
jgi:hypothetical protein